jgi:hypothetical protein
MQTTSVEAGRTALGYAVENGRQFFPANLDSSCCLRSQVFGAVAAAFPATPIIRVCMRANARNFLIQ